MTKKKEKQSAVFYFGISDGIEIYFRRPRFIRYSSNRIIWLCKKAFKKKFPGLNFERGDRGKVKITIEVLERE